VAAADALEEEAEATGGGLSALCKAATREGAGAGGDELRVEEELAPPAADCGRPARKRGSFGAGASRSEGSSEGEPALEVESLGLEAAAAAAICRRSASSRAGLPFLSCCRAWVKDDASELTSL
jgi:hypothetical protein